MQTETPALIAARIEYEVAAAIWRAASDAASVARTPTAYDVAHEAYERLATARTAYDAAQAVSL